MGATDVIDRTLPFSELPGVLKSITPEPINIVYDSISLPETQNALYDALPPGGQLVIVLASSLDQAKVTDDKFVTQVFGLVLDPAQRKIGVSLFSKLTELLAAGDVKVSVVACTILRLEFIDMMYSRIMLKSYPMGLLVFQMGWRS